MKYSLWCTLFGHRWYIRSIGQYYGELHWVISPSDWCRGCGLSKEECGITKIKEQV